MKTQINHDSLEPWQLRMLEEEAELRKRLLSLNNYLMNGRESVLSDIEEHSVLPEAYYRSLSAQKRHMESYLNDLVFQISLWKINN